MQQMVVSCMNILQHRYCWNSSEQIERVASVYEEIDDFIENHDVAIGIIAVPAEYAQDIADILVETKIKGILNFAPVVLTIPDNVEVRNVDLTVNLEVLTYNIEKN